MINLKSCFFWWSSFWYVLMFKFPVIPFSGDVQIAIATAIFLHIVRSVNARTKNITIFFPIACCQTAGARHVAVPFFIYQEILENCQHPVFIFIKEKTFGFLRFSKHFIEFSGVHIKYPGLHGYRIHGNQQ